jgi:DNA invertase Pin-like site-specific DNA recombinase
MRCAIYSRYSSDLQRDSSIEDQTRNSREFASRQNWTVVDEYVLSDSAISGAATAGRKALDTLIAAATSNPRPFDRILVDDTSRLARNVGDALKIIERLSFYGVGVTFVSQGIDSLQKSARPLMTLHGMIDEQFLVGLADKVRRGQEGRVLKGFNPGGKCYGYINVPIEDRSRPGKYGRPAVTGVVLKIHPEQSQVVLRIFEMAAKDIGLARTAKALNVGGVPAPQPPKRRAMQAWCPSAIRGILRNERYRGVQVWNRTQKTRNPETGRKVSKARPMQDWIRVEVPEWRIVPEELWNAVQARNHDVKRKFGASQTGGMSRTENARSYLFSGLLICGECASRIVIISGQGKRGYAKYGCPSHRYRGVCRNALTIRRDRLEAQLLASLEQRIMDSHVVEYILQRFNDELRKRMKELEHRATRLDDLRHARQQLQAKAQHVADAIADAGHSATLLSTLATIEVQIADIDQQLKLCQSTDISWTADEVREFVYRRILQLQDFLRSDPTRLKAVLARHMDQLTLKPVQTSHGAVYEVSGGVNLAPEGNDVMQMVARDGIEPPTPAFSGPKLTAITTTSWHGWR